MSDRCWSDADRELVAGALLTAARSPRYRPALAELSEREREHFDRYAAAVLDALTAAGWRRHGKVLAYVVGGKRYAPDMVVVYEEVPDA